MEEKALIKQTAMDYSMEYKEVDKIRNTTSSEEFYPALEAFIKQRAMLVNASS